ncbi:MAG: biotin transporter BioY [Candidatus Marinimicrobia bacterium]|jgi:biotin transport system substrate-specific component|nr:biotin transporter BioY [Candidatus Neomarinimicrobiota bacterium]
MILTEQLIKSKSLTANIVITLSGSILLALLARLSIPVPFSPVPITGQTFGILFLGTILGSRLGVLSVIAYISEGLIGLPVFAGGTAGFLYLLGPTGGYLIGFIPAVYLVGYLSEKGWTNKFTTTFTTMIICTVIIFIFGISWLAVTAGFETALSIGLYPYLPGAAVKIILATVVVYSINRFNK